MARYKGWENYAAFRSSWGVDQIISTSLVKDMRSSTKSLAKALGAEGIQIGSQQRIDQLTEFQTGLTQMIFQIKSDVENSIKKNVPLATEKLAQIAEFQGRLKGIATETGSGKVGAVAQNLYDLIPLLNSLGDSDTAARAKSLIGRSIVPAITAIGDIAESQMIEALGQKEIETALAEQTIQKAIDNGVFNSTKGNRANLRDSGGYLRGYIDYVQQINKQQVHFSKTITTPLTDINLNISNTNGVLDGEYRISVKQVVSTKQGAKSLRASTLPLGSYMSKITSGNPYFWWTFMRILCRVNPRVKGVQEIKAYIASKNMKEALLGAGLDEVGDFIINGKLYSTDYFIEQLIKEMDQNLMVGSQVLSLTGNTVTAPAKDIDSATQSYIDEKYAQAALARQLILRVGIPPALL